MNADALAFIVNAPVSKCIRALMGNEHKRTFALGPQRVVIYLGSLLIWAQICSGNTSAIVCVQIVVKRVNLRVPGLRF